MAAVKADVFRRILAFLIDAAVASALSLVVGVLLPPLSLLAAVLYMTFKDAIMFLLTKQDAWRNKSVGKRLLDLEIASDHGATIDLLLSAKRNLPLVAGPLLQLTFVGDWIASVVGFLLGAFELFLVLSDGRGRRLGDQWAETQVLPAR